MLQRHVASNITDHVVHKPVCVLRPRRTQLGLKRRRDHARKVRCVGGTAHLLQLRTQQIGIQGHGIHNAHVTQTRHALQHQSPRSIVRRTNPIRCISPQLYLDKRKRLLQARQQLSLVLHAQKGSIAPLHLQRTRNARLLPSTRKGRTLNTAHVRINSPHGRLACSALGGLDAPKHTQ